MAGTSKKFGCTEEFVITEFVVTRFDCILIDSREQSSLAPRGLSARTRADSLVDAMMASLKSMGIDASDRNDIVKKSITSPSVQSFIDLMKDYQ
jgi:hypothetical protein